MSSSVAQKRTQRRRQETPTGRDYAMDWLQRPKHLLGSGNITAVSQRKNIFLIDRYFTFVVALSWIYNLRIKKRTLLLWDINYSTLSFFLTVIRLGNIIMHLLNSFLFVPYTNNHPHWWTNTCGRKLTGRRAVGTSHVILGKSTF